MAQLVQPPANDSDSQRILWVKLNRLAENGAFEPPYFPLSIPGLIAAYDATYGVLNSISPETEATNGQTVRRWLDRSGNERHLNQATGTAQPVLSSGGVLFDGVNDQMATAAALLNDPYTFIGCVNTASDSSIPSCFFAQSGTACYVNTSGRFQLSGGAQNIFTANSSFPLGVRNIVRARKRNPGTSEAASNNTSTSGTITTTITSVPLVIGSTGNSFWIKGRFYEALFYSRYLTSDEVTEIQIYLANKWGVSL